MEGQTLAPILKPSLVLGTIQRCLKNMSGFTFVSDFKE